jgi:hypothetical protein
MIDLDCSNVKLLDFQTVSNLIKYCFVAANYHRCYHAMQANFQSLEHLNVPFPYSLLILAPPFPPI